MLRGGVFIGVDGTKGGLPTLHAAASSAKKMYDWAIDPAHGAMEPRRVHLVSDAAGAVVTPEDAKTAVRDVIQQGVDQLILYFSGHGMIIGNLETWLLSEAPDDSDAAISVSRSAQGARFGVTPHVVIISDACRTPAQELYTQAITGASVFPNNPTEAPEKRVDVFYATAPGRAALELNTAESQGIYTEVLHEALTGAAPEVLGRDLRRRASDQPGVGDNVWFVWSGPLGVYLETAVAERLIALHIDKDQTPKFDVQYGEKNLHWLARVLADSSTILDHPKYRAELAIDLDRGESFSFAVTVAQVANGLVQAIVSEPDTPFSQQLEWAQQSPAPGAKRFLESVKTLAQPFPTPLAPAAAAMRVRGAHIVGATYARGSIEFDDPQRIGRERFDGPLPANVVLEFDNDTVALIPMLPYHITDITVSDREIIAVSFESSHELPSRLSDIRRVRAVVAASARQGRFRLAQEGRFRLAQEGRFRLADKEAREDPALAVYAAYSFYEIQEHWQTKRMNDALVAELADCTLFDVALLASYLEPGGFAIKQWARRGAPIVPYVPLLTQGWELLQGFGIGDLEWFDRMRSMVLPSLWTVFDISARDDLVKVMRA